MLVARRQAIVRLLSSTSTVAKQLYRLGARQRVEAGTVAAKLNSVTAMLEKNPRQSRQSTSGVGPICDHDRRDGLERVLLQPFIPNLFQYQFFQWLVDYAFGFRAYGAPGQPPDNVGPRALLPVPVQPEPWGAMMRLEKIPRNKLKAGLAIVLAALVVFGVAVGIRNMFFRPTTITAFFPTATAIYPVTMCGCPV